MSTRVRLTFPACLPLRQICYFFGLAGVTPPPELVDSGFSDGYHIPHVSYADQVVLWSAGRLGMSAMSKARKTVRRCSDPAVARYAF